VGEGIGVRMNKSWLEGKTALITGAARRIGHEVAVALADEGVNVVAHYRASADEARELSAELRERGVKSWLVKADFETPEEYETLVERAARAAGSLDILVNNAAIFPPSTLQEVQLKDLVQSVQVNAWAPFVLCRDFARLVGKGKIVNLLDTRATGYDWSHVAYILSKKMLAEFTRMAALEFAPGITVNAVAPGLILPPPGKDQSHLDELAKTLPMQRHGDPGDVVQAIIYLLKSDFVTGQVIFVDGGRHLMEQTGGPHPD
jgi:hypothetical protein